MKPVFAPTTDVNSETAILRVWHAADRAAVSTDEIVAEIETSKAIVDVPCPHEGYILHSGPENSEVKLSEPLAHVFETLAALEAHVSEREAARGAETEGPRITDPARHRAEQLGVDLAALPSQELITVQVVEAFAASAATAPEDLPKPLSPRTNLPRVALIGAGMGATQVIDILQASDAGVAVAAIDDDKVRWGEEVMGVPVVGGFDRLTQLFNDDACDAAIISISTSVRARTRLRLACEAHGIPLVNAIDPTARIAADVSFGAGNVVCAFCHFGVSTTVGSNNFFSAYNSFDHHNTLGSDMSTGPACATSGLVKVGDRVRLGTAIYIEPYLELGHDAEVASGSIITASVPPDHAVKRHIFTTKVVPRR